MNYTHYDYLELAPGAASHRIEAAYCALLERFQYGITDAGQDLSGLVRMIHAAYAVLSDPEQRRAYDATLIEGSRSGGRRIAVATRRRGAHRIHARAAGTGDVARDASGTRRLIRSHRFAVAGNIF